MELSIPRAFDGLLVPKRYKAYYGGRGSAKSHSVATVLIALAASKPLRILCCRETQNSIGDSVKQLLDDKISQAGLTRFYTSTKTEITGPNGSRFMFAGLKTETVDSIKSKEAINIAWVEEAHSISQRSLDILRPTIRAESSELWFTWNPDTEYDPVDLMFRGSQPPQDAIIKQVSWKDNPWFPKALLNEMNEMRATDPAKASHIYDGDYQQAPKDAYYAALLAEALSEGRICSVPHDRGSQVHVSFDLGSGQNMVAWFAQWVGREIRLIDYLEGNEEAANEGFTWYARKMREKRYDYAPIIFPHDGRVREATGKSRAETMEGLGFDVITLPALPIDDGIEAVKRMLPMTWIDAEKCGPGLPALKGYRENWDDKLRRSNGPLKDWTNHAADSLRYMAVAYEEPPAKKKPSEHRGPSSWMT